MSNFFSKSPDYFSLFVTGVGFSMQAAQTLKSAFADGNIDADEIMQLKAIEHEGDKHVHKCAKLIADAFITPIDRSDIMELVAAIEDVTDSVDEVANQVYILHIDRADDTSMEFVDLLEQACKGLVELMTDFKDFKKKKADIDKKIIYVNQIEEEGDSIYKEAMRALFDPENNASPVEIIRMQRLYRSLEESLDCMEDVADVVAQIIISNT